MKCEEWKNGQQACPSTVCYFGTSSSVLSGVSECWWVLLKLGFSVDRIYCGFNTLLMPNNYHSLILLPKGKHRQVPRSVFRQILHDNAPYCYRCKSRSNVPLSNISADVLQGCMFRYPGKKFAASMVRDLCVSISLFAGSGESLIPPHRSPQMVVGGGGVSPTRVCLLDACL
jgi:hypothetical protein